MELWNMSIYGYLSNITEIYMMHNHEYALMDRHSR